METLGRSRYIKLGLALVFFQLLDIADFYATDDEILIYWRRAILDSFAWFVAFWICYPAITKPIYYILGLQTAAVICHTVALMTHIQYLGTGNELIADIHYLVYQPTLIAILGLKMIVYGIGGWGVFKRNVRSSDRTRLNAGIIVRAGFGNDQTRKEYY